MKQHLTRWKKRIAENTRLVEGLESKKFRVFSGPRSDANSEISAQLVASLRASNAELQKFIDKLSSER